MPVATAWALAVATAALSRGCDATTVIYAEICAQATSLILADLQLRCLTARLAAASRRGIGSGC